MHECKKIFPTEKIDNCKGEGINRCYGVDDLTLELWYMEKDGQEFYYDNWIEEKVNFCPYCGYHPDITKNT